MIPPLLWVGAAALTFLAGCATQDKKSKPSKPASKKSEGREYQPGFGEDTPALSLFKKLTAHHSHMDLGCPVLKYSAGESWKRVLEGKDDHKISSCELYEYLLNNQDKFSEWIPSITGRPIPWALDETDPPAGLQPYLEKIHKTIGFLNDLLKAKGFKKDSPEYQERMAIGLLYFASVPSIEMQQKKFKEVEDLRLKSDKSEAETARFQELQDTYLKIMAYIGRLDQELARLEMLDFREFHRANGGLFITGDYSKEYSAEEALMLQTGECTEKAKILFAILKKVNLHASFILVDPRISQDPVLRELRKLENYFLHVALELKLPHRTLVLDPAIISLNPDHGAYTSLTPREFLSIDYVGRANNFLSEKGYTLKFLNKALELDDRSYIARLNRGIYWNNRGMELAQSGNMWGTKQYLRKGLEDLNRTIEINPKMAIAFSYRGSIRASFYQLDEALADLNRAIQLDPLISISYRYRGISLLLKGQLEEALEDFSKYLKYKPEEKESIILSNLVNFFESFSFDEAEKAQFESDTGMDLENTQAELFLISILWKAQHPQRALEHFYGLCNQLMKKKNQLKKKGQDFSPFAIKFIEDTFEKVPAKLKTEETVVQWKSSLISSAE